MTMMPADRYKKEVEDQGPSLMICEAVRCGSEDDMAGMPESRS